ncbi:MAG TPA: DJ-1/PfpI family protein [Pyrinomonadaceae bacterium]|jgi:transcriptional regulator GlxA family with amidase domain
MPDKIRSVHILIFEDVEVLDFCGPFEIFCVAGRRSDAQPFDVSAVAGDRRPVITRGGLSVNPKFSFADCPSTDLLLIPGGPGTRVLMNDNDAVRWIQDRAAKAELVLSVCSGALLLGRAGLLDGLAATTHCGAMDELRDAAPNTVLEPTKRIVDNGRVIVSAGVSAGLDLSLYVVERLLGSDHANETARYVEYDWRGSSSQIV